MEHGCLAHAQEVVRQQLDVVVAGIGNLSPPEHAKPRLADPGGRRDVAGSRLGALEAGLYELQGVHPSQDIATNCETQSQNIFADGRQSAAVADDYRQVLRDNLQRAIDARGWSIARPPPVHYQGGRKRGERVGARTIQYMLEADGPAVTLDVLAAVAVALGLQPWELLAPNLSLSDRPALRTQGAVEAEVSRRVAERMQALQGQVSRLLLGNQSEQGSGRAVGSAVGKQNAGPGPRRRGRRTAK